MGLTKIGRTGAMALIAVLWLFLGMAAGPKNAVALTQVTVIEGPGFFTGTPTVFAAQNGIFKKYGLEVRFVSIARATTALEAVRNADDKCQRQKNFADIFRL